jgi:heme oxygenase
MSSHASALEIKQGNQNLTATLKAATQQHHDALETHPFQQRLMNGPITGMEYGRYLIQLHGLHAGLERHLFEQKPNCNAIASVFKPHHVRVPLLLADLKSLNMNDGATHLLPACIAIVEHLASIAASKPTDLLGFLYVLEGSTNGGKFIARVIQAHLKLTQGVGTTYLDPHGPEQRARWTDFKRDLDALELSVDAATGIRESACECFVSMKSLFDELSRDGIGNFSKCPAN